AAELTHRRTHNYPPYQRLARIIIRGRDQQAAADFSERLAGAFQVAQAALSRAAPLDVRLLGPAEAPVFRLKGYYRYHFQRQSPSLWGRCPRPSGPPPASSSRSTWTPSTCCEVRPVAPQAQGLQPLGL